MNVFENFRENNSKNGETIKSALKINQFSSEINRLQKRTISSGKCVCFLIDNKSIQPINKSKRDFLFEKLHTVCSVRKKSARRIDEMSLQTYMSNAKEVQQP